LWHRGFESLSLRQTLNKATFNTFPLLDRSFAENHRSRAVARPISADFQPQGSSGLLSIMISADIMGAIDTATTIVYHFGKDEFCKS
jgi:hypothetical protein